jgi:hypothetical protein
LSRQALKEFFKFQKLMQAVKLIDAFLETLPEPKASEMHQLHTLITSIKPDCKLWFFDGKDETGKVIANPNIGYGELTTHYANGKTADGFLMSISPNSTGISIYLMGIKDKTYLSEAFGGRLGKASITGYCIKFKTLRALDMEVLKELVEYGVNGVR